MVRCVACKVDIIEDTQRDHFKSEWHCYNLKRKIAELPPVSYEVFNEKIVLLRKEENQEGHESDTLYCEVCKKKFNKRNTYEDHLESKKHLIKLEEQCKEIHIAPVNPLKSAGMDIDVEEDDAEDEDVEEWEDGEQLGLEECLICSKISKDMDTNLEHMKIEHSFFLPDPDYLVEKEGLISYLDEKVGIDHACLWCSKMFRSTKSVQQHMCSKGHSKIFCDGDAALEFADYYDFSTSYPDGKCADSPVLQEELDDSGYELRLPSGSVIGHRSLFRYYRQGLPDRPGTSGAAHQRMLLPGSRNMGSVARFMQWTVSTLATRRQVAQKSRDIARARRLENKSRMRLGVKANKMQHHFRPQVIF